MRHFMRQVSSNLIYKILAVVIAVFLWFFAHSEKASDVTLKMPVLINNMPANDVIVNDVPKYIEVSLSGPASSLFRYADSRPAYRVNLSKSGVGSYIFNISPSEFNLPGGIKIQTIYPDSIVSKLVDVGVSIVGNPPRGSELKGFDTDPGTVSVVGPSSVVNGMNVIMTMPVDISGFGKNMTLMVPLSTSGYKMVTVQPQAVIVRFKVVHP